MHLPNYAQMLSFYFCVLIEGIWPRICWAGMSTPLLSARYRRHSRSVRWNWSPLSEILRKWPTSSSVDCLTYIVCLCNPFMLQFPARLSLTIRYYRDDQRRKPKRLLPTGSNLSIGILTGWAVCISLDLWESQQKTDGINSRLQLVFHRVIFSSFSIFCKHSGNGPSLEFGSVERRMSKTPFSTSCLLAFSLLQTHN
jgi:hypothetical protein